MKKQAILGALVAGGIFALSAFSGCGSDPGDVFDEDGGTSGASGTSGTGTSSGTSGIGVGSSGASGGTSGNLPIDLEECGVDRMGGNLTPVELVMIFDKSSSMCIVNGQFSCGAGSRWDAASKAITSFFSAPSSVGLSVAVRSFGPVDNYQPNSVANNNCTAADYSAVEFGPLDLPSAPLAQQSLAEAPIFTMPGGGTNGWMTMTQTGPAIEGTTVYATQRQAQLGETKDVAMLLVSDGDPTGCGTDPTGGSPGDMQKALAAATAASAAGFKLYVLNIGGTKANLDQIAAAGGTTQAITIADPTNATEIGTALAAIRGQTLSCEFPIPKPANGLEPDYTKLNVTYTPPGGGTPEILVQTNDCATNPRGWQYDNPTTPTKINLCATVCEEVLAGVAGEINVVLGCATQTGPVN